MPEEDWNATGDDVEKILKQALGVTEAIRRPRSPHGWRVLPESEECPNCYGCGFLPYTGPGHVMFPPPCMECRGSGKIPTT